MKSNLFYIYDIKKDQVAYQEFLDFMDSNNKFFNIVSCFYNIFLANKTIPKIYMKYFYKISKGILNDL